MGWNNKKSNEQNGKRIKSAY